MPVLAIDTATEVCAVALGEGGRLLGESVIDAGRSHLEMLLPEIHTLLENHGLATRDIRALAVGTGPGTFSGLRVGIATARGLAQGLRVPLRGSSTLEALAAGMVEAMPAGTERGDVDIMPVIDAKRGQVFARLYRCENSGGLKAASEIMCLDPEELLGLFPPGVARRVLAAGNGALAYYEMFENNTRFKLYAREEPCHLVRAAFHVGAASEAGSYDPRDLLAVLPVYVREPDADKTVLLRKREPWL